MIKVVLSQEMLINNIKASGLEMKRLSVQARVTAWLGADLSMS